MGDPKAPAGSDTGAKGKGVSAETDKTHKFSTKPDPALTVKVRTAFLLPPSRTDRYSPGEGVVNATFEIDAKAVPKIETKATKADKGLLKGKEVGFAKLLLAGVADGDHKLVVTHPDNRKSLSVAGPETKGTNQRLYRPVEVATTLESGKLKDARLAKVETHVSIVGHQEDELALDLKPDWMGFHVNSKRKNIDLIIIHHTGGDVIGPAVNQANSSNLGPHYEIDKDGHIVKYVEDDHVANHAAPGQWTGKDGVNQFSVGIEVVHEKGDFLEAQYDSLVSVLQKLVDSHKIPKHRIVSHCDVVMGQDGVRHRPEDPGLEFDRTRLEAKGLGMLLGAAPDGDTIYDGFFKDKSLPHSPAKDSLKVVEEIGNDLRAIGYYVVGTTDFDSIRTAIYQFYQHFFAKTRAHSKPKKFGVGSTSTDVLVDKDVASRIKQVLAGVPAADSKAESGPLE